MLETEIKVLNPLGLHARAAAQLVRLAAKSGSNVRLRRTDTNADADAKSILSVLTLAASKGIRLKIAVDGADEKETLQKIEALFAAGFGEI